MAEVNFGNDGNFSHEKMIQKVNTNLANELGNLCQRSLSMVFKNCDKAIPTPTAIADDHSHSHSHHPTFTEADEVVLSKARALLPICNEAIATQSIHKYVDSLIQITWDANKYFDAMEPWVLRKTNPKRMETVLYVIMEVLRNVAILYQPLMPDSANQILDQLAVPDTERTFDHLEAPLVGGRAISKPKGVFPRIATVDVD